MHTTQELATLLRLDDPDLLFSRTPDGVDGAAIHKALCEAAREIGLDGSNPAPGSRHRVFGTAGRALLEQRAYPSVLHLAEIAEFAKTPPMVHLRLIANWRSGAVEAMLDEASEILGDTSSSAALRQLVRDFLRRQNIERRIEPRIEHLADFVPDIEAAMKDPFLSAPSTGPFPLVSLVASRIARLNGVDPEDQEFKDRICWGLGVHRQMVFLRRLSGQLNAKPQASRTDQERTALEVLMRLNHALVPPDRKLMLADIEDGQSVLLVHAHAGMSTVSNIGLPLGDFAHSMVSSVAGKAQRKQDFNVAASDPNVTMEFTKLAKAMKKSPRTVRIFPDGEHGEMMNGAVCGRDIDIGRGAALLAHVGKAAVYFCGSHWTGRTFEFYLTPGPKGDAYRTKAAFEAAFTEFYCSCLEKIVLGPPEDMAPNGGFWRFFKA